MRLDDLARIVATPGRWGCGDARRLDERTLELSFSRDDDWLRVRVMLEPTKERAFLRFPRCAVRYEGHLAAPDAATKSEVSAILENAGASSDRWLAEDPRRTFATFGAREGSVRELEGGIEDVERWLELEHGKPLPISPGFAVSDVRHAESGTILELRGNDERHVSLVLSERPLQPALDVEVQGAPTGAALTLRTLVRLRARESPVRLRRPHDVRDVGDELKINVNSPCGQSCEFCAIPTDRLVATPVEPLLAKIDLAARRGAKTLRVTGIDPLTFDGTLALLSRARDAGFERLELHGPSTRLSDEAFCRQVLAAAPPRRWFHVPLYGADAAAHDAVVGRAGAFDRVVAALDNLARLEPQRCVTIHTVCTRRVLSSLPGIVSFARARGLAFAADLPFPERESEGDPFVRVAPRQDDVAAALVRTDLGVEDLARVSGLWPCALHARLDPARAGELRALADRGAMRPPSIGARTPMMPCPHADRCAWRPACSGELLRAYVTLHGDGELAPR